jgi:hypothetical protein
MASDRLPFGALGVAVTITVLSVLTFMLTTYPCHHSDHECDVSGTDTLVLTFGPIETNDLFSAPLPNSLRAQSPIK